MVENTQPNGKIVTFACDPLPKTPEEAAIHLGINVADILDGPHELIKKKHLGFVIVSECLDTECLTNVASSEPNAAIRLA